MALGEMVCSVFYVATANIGFQGINIMSGLGFCLKVLS